MNGEEIVKKIRDWSAERARTYGPVPSGTRVRILPDSVLWKSICTDFRRIFWKLVDEDNDLSKAKKRIREVWHVSGGRSIKVCTYAGDYSVLLSDIEDEGIKLRKRHCKKKLKELEAKEENLLIELGKVAEKIDEIKKRLAS